MIKNFSLSLMFLALAFAFGYHFGAKKFTTAAQQVQIFTLKEEMRQKNAIEKLSDFDICRELGGLRSRCKDLSKLHK